MENQEELAAVSEKSVSTRRGFFEQVSVITAGAALTTSLKSAKLPVDDRFYQEEGTVQVSLFINEKRTTLELDPRVTLLDALRGKLHFTGTKKGCDRGNVAHAPFY